MGEAEEEERRQIGEWIEDMVVGRERELRLRFEERRLNRVLGIEVGTRVRGIRGNNRRRDEP